METKRYPIQSYLIAFLMLVLPFWGLHYTSDWEGYEYSFYHPIFSRDIGFSILAVLFTSYGLDYQNLFQFHILLIALSYLNLCRYIRIKPLILVVILLYFYYVQIGNQIRYYLAFPLILYSSYLLYNKSLIKALIVITISITFHKSVIILLGAYIVFFYVSKKTTNTQLLAIILSNIIVGFAVGLIQMYDPQYEDYQEQVSSFAGGLFNSFPYILIISWIFRLNQFILRKYRTIRKDTIYKWLYILSVGSSCFLLAGFKMQILTNRFVASLIPIWFAYFLYIKNSSVPQVCRIKAENYIKLCILLFLAWRYVVRPVMGFGTSSSEMSMMINSYYL
ncbi:MAG: EpsG family protein [Bacteroides sp.]|nr:EpsG family protein [Bacteroides sp.]